MQALVFLTALSLLGGVPRLTQETPPPVSPPSVAPQTAQPATARDFFFFSKALSSLRQGQISSRVTMDIKGEGLAVAVTGSFSLVHKFDGAYISELTVQPPLGGKAKRYKVTHDGKTTWIQDLGTGTYALQKVTDENEFLVRGLLTGLAKTALGKLEPAQLKLLDAAEPTPELAAELEAAVKQGDDSLKVRDETVDGKPFRVYELRPEKDKGTLLIYVNAKNRPERLTMDLMQDKLKINFTEVIKSSLAVLPEKPVFRFVPTRKTKKVKKIDLGSF